MLKRTLSLILGILMILLVPAVVLAADSTATQLPKPTGLSVAGRRLEWDANESVTSWYVAVRRDGFVIAEFIRRPENNYSDLPEELFASGSYTYKVVAQGDGTTTLDSEPAEYGPVNFYTITWVDDFGKKMASEVLPYGEIPVYPGGTPTKPADNEHEYVFKRWRPASRPVDNDQTYTALFDMIPRSYTVKWVTDEGDLLNTSSLYYGNDPTDDAPTPPDLSDDQYTAVFDRWEPAMGPITGDTTYTAIYNRTLNSYTVTWKNHDGTVLDTDTLPYGATPAYTGATPTKPADAQYTYTFAGWDKNVEPVTGNVTYKATFTSTVNQYTVTWLNDDGTVLDTDTVPYGAMPRYTGDTPTKPADDKYVYTFADWSPQTTPVMGDATYIAMYTFAPVPVVPATGDDTPITLCLALLLLSGVGMAVTKRKNA